VKRFAPAMTSSFDPGTQESLATVGLAVAAPPGTKPCNRRERDSIVANPGTRRQRPHLTLTVTLPIPAAASAFTTCGGERA
jgi:hypothetical protein